MLRLLHIDLGTLAQQELSSPETPFVVGTESDCGLVLEGREVAGRHCRVEASGSGYRVLALHSEHGIELNGHWVARAVLNEGDVLRIGRHQLLVRECRSVAATDKPLRPEPATKSQPASNEGPSPAARPVIKAAPLVRASSKERMTQRRSTSASVPIVLLVGFLVLVSIAFFQWGGGGASPDRSFEQEIQAVLDDLNRGQMDRALQKLEELEQRYPSGERGQRIEEYRGKSIAARDRFQTARRQLDEVEELADVGRWSEVLERIGFIDRQGGEFESISKDIRRLREQAQRHLGDAHGVASLSTEKNAREWLAEAKSRLLAEDFSKALSIVEALKSSDRIDSREVEVLRAEIESSDEAAGRKLLALVQEFLDDHRWIVAINHLQDDEIRSFAGTSVWYDLLEKADEIEDRIDQEIPSAARPFSRRKHARARPQALQEASRVEESSPRPPSEKGPTSSRTNPVPEDSFEQLTPEEWVRRAEEAVKERRFEEALRCGEGLRRLGTGGEHSTRMNRLADWARLGGQLPVTLMRRREAQPDDQTWTVRLIRGAKATLFGTENGQWRAEVEGEPSVVSAREISPASLLLLAARQKLSAAEQMERAFFALSAGDDKSFWTAVEKAAQAAELKPIVDSAIAFARGVDPVPEGGFVRCSERWLTLEERERALLEEEIETALARLLAGEGPAGEETFFQVAARGTDIAVGLLKAALERLKAKFVTLSEYERWVSLQERRRQLDQARAHALDLIFDEQRYFYPYDSRRAEYERVQREVEERVAGVRELWGNELSDEAPSPTVSLARSAEVLCREVRLICSLWKGLDATFEAQDPAVELVLCLPADVRVVSIRNIALSPGETESLAAGLEVESRNRALHGPMTPEELEQVRITNAYRSMLGRRSLALHESLYAAAREHSVWMNEHGQITHFEDDPERRSPFDRMRAKGYLQGAGENCHYGSSSALLAHQSWLCSSGHHRNLLAASHTEMGSGVSGVMWTQNFGGAAPYSSNWLEE